VALAVGDTAAQSPLTPFERDKAEWFLRERLPCLGCHRLGDEGGRIGPSLGDVAARRSAAYIAAMIADPQRTVPGTVMPKIPMPDDVRALLVRYLARGGTGVAKGVAPPTAEAAGSVAERASANGAALYARHCAACHGGGGRGDGPNARDLPVAPAVHASAAEMSKRTDDRLFDAIHAGGFMLGRSARMPAYGETLSRSEIRLLVRHIRRLCGCSGPAWSSDGEARAP
jgi:mono/diheme cytochrome c family protein